MKKWTLSILITLMTMLSFAAHADELADVNKALAGIIPNQKPDNVKLSPIPGLYEVTYGSDIFYVSKDGRYVIQGDVIDTSQHKNITELQRAAERIKLVSALDEKDMVVFSPKEVKHTITVFADVDCQYCRKMHKEVAELNKAGIKVRYLAFPRTGIDTPSYYKMVSVWCAKDRNSAITKAEADEPIEEKTCTNPVKQHLAVAKKLGITGTPTLLFEDGQLVPGYIPAAQLIKALDEQG